jgi:hypothetical protein
VSPVHIEETDGVTTALATVEKQSSISFGEPVGVHITKTGLAFTRSVAIDEWIDLGKKLKKIEGAIQWWVGDWLNYGEKVYGAKYTEALQILDYEEKSLRNIAPVSKKVEMSRRRDSPSWGHHAEVAVLEPKQQAEMLDWAGTHGASVRDLRTKIKNQNQPSPPPTHPLEELQRQLSPLHAARCDGQENLFVQSLARARSASIADDRVELAQVVIDRLRSLANELIDCADEIQQHIPVAKVA